MTITDTPEQTVQNPAEEAIEAFADKVFADILGTLSTYAATIGVALGWYDALAGTDSMNPAELATATDTDERYAQEWLEQQTVSGYLSVVDADASPRWAAIKWSRLTCAGGAAPARRSILRRAAPRTR